MAVRKPDPDTWLQHGVDLGSRTLLVFASEIDASVAERTVKALHMLDATEGTITLKIANCGGEWDYGLAIYDAVNNCRNEVAAIAYGIVASMGAVVFQAADVRVMMPNATMMVHYGTDSISEHALNVQRYAGYSKTLRVGFEDIMLAKIQAKRKMTRTQFRDRFAFDVWLTAQDAVEIGLADYVWGAT